MSLAKTLIKVAIGVAVAKGVNGLIKGTSGGGRAPTGRTAGVDDIMDGIGGAGTGRRYDPSSQSGGGLGDLLSQLGGQKTTQRQRPNAPRGGLEDMLGGGRAGQSGGLGDLLGQLAGAATGTRGASSGGGLGDLLGAVLGGTAGGALAGGGASAQEPSRDDDLAAALILRAMVAAVKSDGDLDAAEKQKLMQHLDGASREEIAYVNAELERRTSVDDLASQVPQGMEEQVYLMSLMAIDLDNQNEAQHLDQLAKALALEPREVNALHDRAGAPRLYN
jgi:uncharacterized membrane protein YebE (DUF533 family)